MSKAIRHVVLTVTVLTILLAVLAAAAVRKWEYHWQFEESTRSIANPGRGFYIQVKTDRIHKIEDAAEEVRLILLTFDLEDYTEEELPEEKLEELREAIDVAKKEHMAVIFRAAYGFHREVEEPERMELVDRHIQQISEVLNSYRDQILVVQAGILGAYGEWHSSRYLEGTEEEKRESRLHILRQWELYLYPDIKVDVRRPRFVREAAAEGILADRLGVHNDALLSTDSDMGTYDDPGMEREDELVWMQENLLGQINGGEMPTPGELNVPENADREFAQQHTGYLNLRYNEEIIDRWAAMIMEDMDAKSYLENHLGYRLFLTGLDVRRLYFTGELLEDGVQMHIGLCNSGYAPLMEKYKVYVTVGSGENSVSQEIGIPELYRICNGQSVKTDITVKVPEEFLDGKEKISIGLKIAPDMDERDGQDCVELANQDFIYCDGVNRIVSLDREGKFLFRMVR